MLTFLKHVLVVIPLLIFLGTCARADEVREIGWAHLVPPVAQTENLKLKGFLNSAEPPLDGGAALPSQIPEANWLSSPMQQPGDSLMPAVVEELDGKRVRIGGYVVPLDFDMTKVQEFLLVPFVGACIHVPPPPANQIIYVKAKEPFEVAGQFEPVYVTGIIRTQRQSTGLAATGYSMEADEVSSRDD